MRRWPLRWKSTARASVNGRRKFSNVRQRVENGGAVVAQDVPYPMAYIDFLSVVHKSTKRDYLARVNDPDYPKARAAELAKKWGYDYWDGDRRINYGGYRYMEGRWEKVARAMAEHYGLNAGDRILDVGCGKGFLLFDFTKVVPGIEVHGIDISDYAIANAKEEIKDRLRVGNATALPYPDRHFDRAPRARPNVACAARTTKRSVRYAHEKRSTTK